MTRLVRYVMMLSVMTVLLSCQKDRVYGNGLTVESVHDIAGGYSRVMVNGEGMEMLLDSKIPDGQVVVRCDEEVLPYVSVKSARGELTIGYKNALTFSTPLKTEVYVSCDESIELYSAVNAQMRTLGMLDRDSLAIVAENSSVNMSVSVDALRGEIGPGCSAVLVGDAASCMLTIDRSFVEASALETKRAKVQMTFSELRLWCEERLQAQLQNRSLLRYKGECTTDLDVDEDSSAEQYGE